MRWPPTVCWASRRRRCSPSAAIPKARRWIAPANGRRRTSHPFSTANTGITPINLNNPGAARPEGNSRANHLNMLHGKEEITMPAWDPNAWFWGEAMAMLDRAERLQRQFFQVHGTAEAGPTWSPPVDVFEYGDELSIVAALPEVAPGQVEVSVEAGNLVLRGERPLPQMCRRAQIRQLEIPYGRFERRIPLPAGRFEVLGKSLSNGCFVLTLRRSGPGASP